ncbi:DUF4870 family protein [Phytohalomonas tamaricis]|uniref:DUF4870 family protein n=1 Tax=Phytohalomonas tamaricis TaxID=2081032 RepID=UPI000D0AE2F6|nr:DUF4870 domain-containing protein [Phytohalomonas tamaricis]
MTSPETITYVRDDENPTIARVIYILYLVSLAAGITAVVGLVMAYIYKRRASPWLAEHYRFQIRTFWIGALYLVAAFFLSFIVVGFIVMGAVYIWTIVRCVRGWIDLERGRAPEPVENWWW